MISLSTLVLSVALIASQAYSADLQPSVRVRASKEMVKEIF